LLTTLGCSGFILRYGAIRMTQVGMASLALGLAGAATGFLPLFALAALAVGLGSAVSTPSSSHLLVRYATPRQGPLVFSIKQTGVPLGLMLAGVLAPFLVVVAGWRGSLLAMAAICLAVALPLQLLRAGYDGDRNPAQPLSVLDVKTTVRDVLARPDLRTLGMAAFAFVGLQSVFSAFIVLYLVDGLSYSLGQAGWVFSMAMAGAVPARIFWGWIAGRFVEPHRLLAALGVLMAVAAGLTAVLAPGWHLAAVTAVAVLFSATAVSWHGVLIAEVARLAPPGRVGAMTGGVLAFGDAAALVLPLLFSGLLVATGSYGIGFAVAGVPALAIAVYLACGGMRASPGGRDAGSPL
ncbi:MAG: MFS transporter, partial [Alphaproteobacteria bacterium]